MKFLCEVPGLHVYNPKTRKIFATFQDGVFSTENEYEMQLLDNTPGVIRVDRSKPVKSDQVEDEAALESLSVTQLRRFAASKEITIPSSIRAKAAIIALIENDLNVDDQDLDPDKE